jgi:hypothetical protein
MKMRITRTGVTLLAAIVALAIGAVASTSASAAELEQIPSSGKFTVSAAGGTFETKSGSKITCKTVSGSGEVTGVKTATSKVTFEGCTSSGFKCTAGKTAGNIETEINGELVWLSKSGLKAGQKLSLAKELSVTCAIIKIAVKGSSLCPVEPVNTKTTTIKLVCTQTGGKQSFTEYENEKGEKFKAVTESNKGGGFEESGLSSTESLSFSTMVEVKVV